VLDEENGILTVEDQFAIDSLNQEETFLLKTCWIPNSQVIDFFFYYMIPLDYIDIDLFLISFLSP